MEEAQRPFHVAAGSRREALIQLALQADISIIDPDRCHGDSPAISGNLTLTRALTALLAGGDCRFEWAEPRTVRLARLRPTEARAPIPAPATRLSEIVVTTAKSESSIDDLAGSVSVVGAERIRATGAADAADLTPLLRGVISTNLGPGRNKLMLRGLSDGVFTGHTQSSVGIFLDNVPLTRDAPDPDLRISDVQRVEIARGPQGALYGAGAVAGIYRIVTQPPQLARQAGSGSVTWSSTREGGLSHAGELMLNLPLLSHRAALRLVGYDEIQGGFIRAGALRRSTIDRTLRRGARAALRLQLSDAWRLDLSAMAQRLTTTDTHYVMGGWGRFNRPRRLGEAHWNDVREGALTIDGAGDWGHLTSTTGYVDHRFSSNYDATTALPGLQPTLAPGHSAIYREQVNSQLLVHDTTLHSPAAQRLRWLVGVYLSASNERSPSSLQIHRHDGEAHDVFDEVRRDRVREAALYGDLSYDFGGGWTANLGARAFEGRISHSTDDHLNREIQHQRRRLTFSGASPMLSLQHSLANGGTVYLLYSEGYRLGGTNSLSLNRRRHAPPTFTPDHLQNYELGLKARLLDRKAWLHMATFYEAWRNIQSDQYTWGGAPFTANVGNARDLGVGADAGYLVTRDLTVEAQVQYTDAELVHPNPAFMHHPAGALPGVPRFSAGALIEYRRPLADNLTFGMIAEASYTGRSHVTFDVQSASMGDYVTDRLSAELTASHWSASVFADNLTDASRNTFAFGNPFSFHHTRQMTPQRPRTLGMRLSRRF